MNYSREVIEKLTELFKSDSPAALNWLTANNKELVMLKEGALGDTKALEWLIRNKFIFLAAVSNAMHGDSKALDLLLKMKAIVWAATANAANEDEKAAAWLIANKLEHYSKLATVMGERIKRDSDDGFMQSMFKAGSPY